MSGQRFPFGKPAEDKTGTVIEPEPKSALPVDPHYGHTPACTGAVYPSDCPRCEIFGYHPQVGIDEDADPVLMCEGCGRPFVYLDFRKGAD